MYDIRGSQPAASFLRSPHRLFNGDHSHQKHPLIAPVEILFKQAEAAEADYSTALYRIRSLLRSMRLSAALSETECDKIAAGQRARQSILYDYRLIRARMGAAIFDIARTLSLAAERQAGHGVHTSCRAPR